MNQYNNQVRSNRRKARSGNRNDAGQSGFLSVLLFYVLPFIIVNGLIFFLVTSKPKGEITIGESSDYISTTMELKINSLLPLKGMEVTLDGAPVELTKTGLKTYSTVLTNNGGLEIKLTSFNKMKTILHEQVNVLDDTPPVIKDKVFEDGVLSFRLEDSQSGVDYSSISGCDDDNQVISPLSIDRSTGRVTFELKKDNFTITAKDKIGNELHRTFTPQGESVEEEEIQDIQAEDQTES
ncbi:MAG: hypothetical protein LBT06_17585 [Hungatella sp.]|jgi:hypothetical protein|nr:hypothetical protein [Hungatella sp.]MDR1550379.1 hypothetical protein [Hungatella sp.]